MRTFNLEHSAANICPRRTSFLVFFFYLWCSLAPLWLRYCTLTWGGKRWSCFLLEALLRPRAVHRHTLDGWVMAARDGRTFPLAGSQDSESPKPQGSNGKAITFVLRFLITPAVVQKWVTAARDSSNILQSSDSVESLMGLFHRAVNTAPRFQSWQCLVLRN